MTVVCEQLRKNGYPLRIGIACDQFQFSWPLRGFSLSTGRLRVDAPIYVPRWLEFNVHSPASIIFSEKKPIVLHWRKMVIETEPWKMGKTFKLMAEGFEASSMASSLEDQKFLEKLGSQTKNQEIRQDNIEGKVFLKKTPDVGGASLNNARFFGKENALQKIAAEFLRLDLKQEKNHFSGHIIFDDFDASLFFAPYFIDFPKVDGNLKWTFNNVFHLFKNGGESWKRRLYGKSGFLKYSELTFHTGGGVRVSGPFSFDDEGYLTAEFELVLVQHTKLLTTMQRFFPEKANNVQALLFVLDLMPRSADGYPILPLLINHGQVKLGFLKLGHLAPL
ncbi:DUF2125 domain-containing protein [Bartonella rattaustraliani]|uniref:DUF2125 domain-containing protein n=1 Tax=Bartonella rattaustraliani TaxID=481139 RepID=UPI0002DADD0F